MRMSRLWYVGLIPLAVFLHGCGGAGMASTDTRGEGNIPIGRVTMPPGQVRLTVTNRYGEPVAGSIDPQGVMWMARTAVGQAGVSLQPADGNLDPVGFNIVFGINQEYVIDAAINKKKPDAVVLSLVIELPNGKDPVLGKSCPVKVTATGTNIGGLKPTVWVDGGIGYVDKNHKFVATSSGSGVIHATLRGVTADLQIHVQ
jgi:hypothetical protein